MDCSEIESFRSNLTKIYFALTIRQQIIPHAHGKHVFPHLFFNILIVTKKVFLLFDFYKPIHYICICINHIHILCVYGTHISIMVYTYQNIINKIVVQCRKEMISCVCARVSKKCRVNFFQFKSIYIKICHKILRIINLKIIIFVASTDNFSVDML